MIEIGSITLWLAAQFFAAAYCLLRAVFDFRKRRPVWGVLGVAAALAILLSPIPTRTAGTNHPAPATSK
ncbi:hypothetical protein RXV95_05125 [Novosphingobium sp. ZN18A2]|uniref:hypothetical protein n=1 Tax=Novosphingobium sp. ZN18A2 TaxID=3079861 RepID=UPI0030CC5357